MILAWGEDMLCQTASVSSNCDLRSRLLFCLISFNFFCNVLVRIKVPSPYMFLTQNICWGHRFSASAT